MDPFENLQNIEMLRQEAVIKSKDYIFPISVDVLQNSNPEKLEEYKAKLEKNIEGLNSKILDVKSKIDREQEYLNEVKIFEQTYSSKNIIDSLYENVDNAKSQIEKLEKEQKDLSNNIQNNNEKKEELSKENVLLEKEQKSILEEIEVLNELKNINNELQKLQNQISEEKSNEQILKESLEEKTERVQEIEDEISLLEKQINNLENQKNRYLIKLSELTEFEKTESIEESFEEIETTYKALSEKFSTSESTYNQLVKILNMCNQNMNNCQNRIEENGYYVQDFEEKNQMFERINESDLKSYKTNIDILEKNIKSLKDRLTEKDKADIIYLCSPNNPTGATITKAQLQEWVDYANKIGAVIIYDAAYEAYISEEGVPHTIYECEGARTCAIELRSFSKNAGFTGVRLGFTVVPKDLVREGVALHDLWARRHGTKFNGAPYIVQRAGEAVYSPEGKAQLKEQVAYYMRNAHTIYNGLKEAGYSVSGGVNAPYIWLKTPNNMSSWDFFDYLLETAHVVGTPGSGFGAHGEGFFRLTAFGTYENTLEAIRRIKAL